MLKKIALSLFAGVLLLVPASVYALEYEAQDESYRLSEEERVQDDLYIFSGTASVAGDVEGDLFVFSGTADISGDVEGDLWVFGGQVNVSGAVGDDLRVVGGMVALEGEIGDDLLVAGGTVDLREECSVSGDLYASAGSMILAGQTEAIRASVGNLTIEDSADLGQVEYWSNEEASVAGGSKVENIEKNGPIYSAQERVLSEVYAIVVGFIMILLLLLVFPWKTRELAEDWIGRFGENLVWGLLSIIIIPILAILLLVSVLLAPVGVGIIFFYATVWYLGYLIGVLGFGYWIYGLFRGKDNKYAAPISAGLGIIVYYLAGLIPGIGFIVVALINIAGFGVIVAEVWRFLSFRRANNRL